jgi:predicted DNA-binding WGR domain protein
MRDNDRFRLYRFYHVVGTSKDWAIRINNDGTLTRKFGKTGSRLNTSVTPLNSGKAFQKLINQKLNKGYQYLGEFYIDDNGKVLDSPPLPSTAHQPIILQSFIYWRVSYISIISIHDPILTQYLGIMRHLSDILLTHVPEQTEWIKAFVRSQPAFEGNGATGKLLKTDSAIPLLFLMALKKCVPVGFSVSLSSENLIDISDQLKLETQALSFFGTTVEQVRPIAEALGLLVKKLDLSGIQTEVADCYF